VTQVVTSGNIALATSSPQDQPTTRAIRDVTSPLKRQDRLKGGNWGETFRDPKSHASQSISTQKYTTVVSDPSTDHIQMWLGHGYRGRGGRTRVEEAKISTVISNEVILNYVLNVIWYLETYCWQKWIMFICCQPSSWYPISGCTPPLAQLPAPNYCQDAIIDSSEACEHLHDDLLPETYLI